MNSIPKYRAVTCDSCQVLVINNVICHETGCPNAWKDETRECKWCGRRFKPENSNQQCCDSNCADSYNS
jgi:hypothetical protein